MIDAHFHRNNIATTDDYILIEMLPLFLSRMILLFGCIVFTMHVHIILPFNEVSVDFCAISVFIRNLARMPSNKGFEEYQRYDARSFAFFCVCVVALLWLCLTPHKLIQFSVGTFLGHTLKHIS